MNEPIFNILKSEYDLKANHLKILKVLEKNRLDAFEISSASHIPMGRIYEFLNELVSNKLILKDKQEKRFVFYIDELSKRVKEFIDLKVSLMVDKKIKTAGVIDAENKNVNIRIINNPLEYYLEQAKLDSSTKVIKWVYPVIFLPEIFYPDYTFDSFKTVQKWFKKNEPLWNYSLPDEVLKNLTLRNFDDLLERGIEIKFLIEKDSLQKYFKMYSEEMGKAAAIKKIKRIKHLLHKYKNLQIRLTEDSDIEFGLSGEKLFFRIFNQFFHLVLIIEDKESYRIYSTLFDQNFAEANNNIRGILDRIVKSLTN